MANLRDIITGALKALPNRVGRSMDEMANAQRSRNTEQVEANYPGGAPAYREWVQNLSEEDRQRLTPAYVQGLRALGQGAQNVKDAIPNKGDARALVEAIRYLKNK